jgi:restriction endonuclease Mrr
LVRQELIAEVRDRIAAVSPTAFEDLVLDVLHAMGYGDGTSTRDYVQERAVTPGSMA